MGADQRAGSHNDVPSECGITRQVGRRMDRVDELKPHRFDAPSQRPPRAVISDGNNAAVDVMLRAEARQIIRSAQRLQSVDSTVQQLWMGINEADQIETAVVAKDVENDPPVPAATEDDTSPGCS